jgi:hypothetical protein
MQALSQLSYTPTRKGAHYSHRLDRRNRAALRNVTLPLGVRAHGKDCAPLVVFLRTKNGAEPCMLDLI